jgi:hypothetical protein
MNQLNIPLSNTDKPIKGILLPIVFFLALLLLSWTLTRLHITMDTTSWLRPQTSAYTLHIPVQAKSMEQITQNIGSSPLFAGNIWSFDQLPLWCQRSCSLHLDKNGLTHALTIDRILTTKEQNEIRSTGLFLTENDDLTLISTQDSEQNDAKTLILPSLRLLVPWNDAILITHSTNGRTSVQISERGMAIKGRFGVGSPHQTTLSQDISPIAQFTFPADNTPYPLSTYATQQTLKQFFERLESEQISIILGNQGGEVVFSIQAPIVLSQHEAAELSREIIKPSNLSTLEWTIDDGTLINELRFSDEHLSIETRSDGENFFMDILNDEETILRLTQTSDNLTISNQEISLTSDQNTESSCLANSRTFIRPLELIEFFENSNSVSQRKTYPLFSLFNEIAFSESKATMCW